MKSLRPCSVFVCFVLSFPAFHDAPVEGADGSAQAGQPGGDQEVVDVAIDKEQKWKVSQPSPDPKSMLRRFVEECVSIAPGRLKIPREKFDSTLSDELVITRGYRICRFETTQELYRLVTGVNPSRWTGPRNSVEQVTYGDAVRFCEKLTAMLRSQELIDAGDVVRLPSDVEWEFACRAGAKTKYCFGDLTETADGSSQLDEYAWHTGNAAGNDPSVGALKANRWQLADVHGYLWEFTQTAKPAKGGPVFDVRIWGGSWTATPQNCGCSSTEKVSSTYKAPDLGFRCVISRKVTPKNTSRQ